MVILDKIEIKAGCFMKTPATKAFAKESTFVAEHLGLDDFDVGDCGFDYFHVNGLRDPRFRGGPTYRDDERKLGWILSVRNFGSAREMTGMDSGSRAGMTGRLENAFIDDLH